MKLTECAYTFLFTPHRLNGIETRENNALCSFVDVFILLLIITMAKTLGIHLTGHFSSLATTMLSSVFGSAGWWAQLPSTGATWLVWLVGSVLFIFETLMVTAVWILFIGFFDTTLPTGINPGHLWRYMVLSYLPWLFFPAVGLSAIGLHLPMALSIFARIAISLWVLLIQVNIVRHYFNIPFEQGLIIYGLTFIFSVFLKVITALMLCMQWIALISRWS